MAVYGVDNQGRPYIHQKVYKQRRIFGETVFRDGIVSIRCRECLRWTKVRLGSSTQPPGGTQIRSPEVEAEDRGHSLRPADERK